MLLSLIWDKSKSWPLGQKEQTKDAVKKQTSMEFQTIELQKVPEDLDSCLQLHG